MLKQWNVLDELLNANNNVDINQIDSILLEDVGDYYKNFGNKIKLELLDTIFDSLDYEVIKNLIRLKVFKSFYVIQVGASSFCFDMIEELVMPNILKPCVNDTLIIKKHSAISRGHCSGFPYGEIEFNGKVLAKNDLGCEILIKPENHKLGWNHWTADLHIYDRYTDTIIPISGSYYVK